MKGSIRVVTGFLVTFGAVGTLDFDPNASVVTALIFSLFGLIILYSGTKAMEKQETIERSMGKRETKDKFISELDRAVSKDVMVQKVTNYLLAGQGLGV